MKKFTLFTALVILHGISSAQPDHWTVKTALAGHGRMAGAAFSIGNKGFVGIGTDWLALHPQLKDFWEYDPATDTYSQIADYPGGGVNGAGTFTIGDKGYVCSGAGNGNFYNDLWAYDTLTNAWAQKSSLPGPARDYTVGFAVNGKGYIATGYNGSQNMNDVWEYDPVSDSWTAKMSISQARSSAAGFAIGNKGYIATGYVTGGTVDCWEFDPAANTWMQKADVDTIQRSDGVGFSLGGYGYICCGYGINYPDNDLWEYDPVANTWTNRTYLNGPGRANPVAFVAGLKAYVFGGADIGAATLSDMYEYSQDTLLINSAIQLPNQENELMIYPNPASGLLKVKSKQGEINGLEIFNSSGEKIFSCKGQHEIDVSSLAPGIYFLSQGNLEKKAVKFLIK
jgi:N-acetylneuraminic acid mutarotase